MIFRRWLGCSSPSPKMPHQGTDQHTASKHHRRAQRLCPNLAANQPSSYQTHTEPAAWEGWAPLPQRSQSPPTKKLLCYPARCPLFRNLVINRCREALGRQQTTFIDLPRPPPAPRKSLTRRTTHLLIADHLGHGRSLPCSTALTADVDAEEITWLLVRREWSSHDVFTHSADESRVVELSRSPTRLILELITSKWLRVEWKCETPLTALTTNDCPNRTLGRRTL